MHAFLYEVAYMPSNLAGFSGMISGYLDVPPPFATGGVTNTIGSGFLDGIQGLAAGPRDTVFRFHTFNPVFDTSGRVLLDDQGTLGQMQMGAVIPEPASLILLGLGTLSLLRRKY